MECLYSVLGDGALTEPSKSAGFSTLLVNFLHVYVIPCTLGYFPNLLLRIEGQDVLEIFHVQTISYFYNFGGIEYVSLNLLPTVALLVPVEQIQSLTPHLSRHQVAVHLNISASTQIPRLRWLLNPFSYGRTNTMVRLGVLTVGIYFFMFFFISETTSQSCDGETHHDTRDSQTPHNSVREIPTGDHPRNNLGYHFKFEPKSTRLPSYKGTFFGDGIPTHSITKHPTNASQLNHS
jgi:hypothetical protein